MDNGEYIDGKKEGLWISYYANGNKMREGRYVKGKKEGLWIQYWENGNKRSEATFVNGLYTGLYTSYHSNGNRRVQGIYNEYCGQSSDGTKDGPWHCYAGDGETVIRIITYKRGSRTQPDRYPLGEERFRRETAGQDNDER